MIEALHRAKFKFLGHQKPTSPRSGGFTEFNVDESENMIAEKQLTPEGCGVEHKPLDKWWALHS